MGHLIRFIHNRDLAVENICTAYIRTRLLLSTHPDVIASIKSRFEEQGYKLPSPSILFMPEQTAFQLPGYFGVNLLPSRRNSRIIDMTDTRQMQRIHSLYMREDGRAAETAQREGVLAADQGRRAKRSRHQTGVSYLLAFVDICQHMLTHVHIYINIC
jgi:hypothetical protein